MKKFCILVFVLPLVLNSQVFNYKDYWKNRKPNSAYWQQDVHYTINAIINDEKDEISGEETLEYFNNSPDELNIVYFHLYQNAFQPGSYAHALNEVNKELTKFGHYEAQKMGTQILSFKIDGQTVPYTIDNTILIAKLPKPLASGASLKFDISFKTYWDIGTMRRRFKTFNHDGSKHYDGVHWYPRISVYDRKFGWTTDQHLGREFYGDYGVYDVNLSFPSNFVVEATGELTNEKTVLPDDLRQKLDIANYSKPATSPKDKGAVAGRVPSGYTFVVPREGTKTWKYHAENVHDFAFTADPSYRIGESKWNGIRCIALAQEQNAAYWYPTSEFIARVIETYSNDIGMYGYPKIVAADARDGMEYPMITLDGGNWPGHQYVIAHEIGHNWFYGMIGNNETYRAMLDEGFTQFLTSWSIKKINKIPMHANAYDEQVVYNGYLNDAINHTDAFLNTHSDDFASALGQGGGYRHVYFKTATMLYNLQYVLGDELFLKAMQYYFNKWKFAHPYPEDFRQAIIEYTHVDLNWYFDQWMETTKTIDYKIENYRKIKNKSKDGKYYYELKFRRKGDMQMPLDITVKDKNGKAYQYLIPNTYFAKSEGRTVLKLWRGWGLLNQTYVDTIALDSKLISVEIDTTNRLADIYRLDNVMKRHCYDLPSKININKGISPLTGFNHQNYTWQPDFWFNAVDGVKAGLNAHYEYAKVRHVLDVSAWYNTGLYAEKKYDSKQRDVFSYKLVYRDLIGKDAYFVLDTRYLDGVYYNNFGIEKSFGKNKLSFKYKTIYLEKNKGIYWPYLDNVSREGKTNASINIDYQRTYKYKHGVGIIKSSLRGNGLTKDYAYGSWKTEVINHNHLGKIDIHTRWFIQHIEGSNIPEEFMLNLAGANMEDYLESKYTRSRAYIPQEWLGYGNTTNHFQMGGGLNLRGYAGYLAPVTVNGVQYNLYKGNGGSSASLEIDFDRLIKFSPKLTKNWLKLDLYGFADAGFIYNTNITTDKIMSPMKVDAGLGSALSITKWGKRNLIQPLTIRFDMPFFLNTQPYADKNYLQSRWVFGLGRSF